MSGRSEESLDIVKRAVKRYADQTGGTYHSGVWFWRGGGVVTAFELQKSQYGESYYGNIAFGIPASGRKRLSKVKDADIQVRVGALPDTDDGSVAELFDLEQPIADEERSAWLGELMRGPVHDVLVRGVTTNGLRAMFRDGTLKGAMARRSAFELLGLPVPT